MINVKIISESNNVYKKHTTTQVVFVLGMPNWLMNQTSVNVICHINRLKEEKSYDHIKLMQRKNLTKFNTHS